MTSKKPKFYSKYGQKEPFIPECEETEWKCAHCGGKQRSGSAKCKYFSEGKSINSELHSDQLSRVNVLVQFANLCGDNLSKISVNSNSLPSFRYIITY